VVAAGRLCGFAVGCAHPGRAVWPIPVGQLVVSNTRRVLVVAGGFEGRTLRPALLFHPGTPVGEGAVVDVRKELRWRPADGLQFPAGRADVGKRLLEQVGVGVFRAVEQRLGGAAFGDLAAVEHRHRVTRLEDDRDVVCDEQHTQVPFLAELFEVAEDLVLHDDVERRRRFVGDDQRRLQQQRERDERTLFHPAGELVWVVVDARLGEADDVEQVSESVDGGLLAPVGVSAREFDGLLADAHHRVEAVHRRLGDQRHLVPPDVLVELPLVERLYLGAVEPDRPGDDLCVVVEAADQRLRDGALARPALADQAEVLAGLDLEGGVGYGPDVVIVGAIRDVQVFDFEEWCLGHVTSPPNRCPCAGSP